MRLRRCVPALCVATWILAACHDVSGPNVARHPELRAAAILVTVQEAMAGQPATLVATVFDSAGLFLPSAMVQWQVGAGTLAGTSSLTDSVGEAHMVWTPPMTVGQYGVTVTCGSVTRNVVIGTRSGYATRAELATQSVTVTRFNQNTSIAVTLFDKDGNKNASASHLELVTDGPVTALWGLNQSSVFIYRKFGAMRGSGTASIRVAAAYDAATPVLATIAVDIDIGVKSMAITGAADGATVGETLTLGASVTDSSDVTQSATTTELGNAAAFSSSDPAVAEISASGTVVAKSVGSTTVTLTFEGRQWSTPFPVVTAFDLGALASLYNLRSPELYFTQTAAFDTSGTSLLESRQYGRPSTANGTALLEMYNVDGARSWSRTYTLGTSSSVRTAFAASGGAYVSETETSRLSRLSSSGADAWTVAAPGGGVFADATAVFVTAANVVRAFDASNGNALWQNSTSEASAFVGVVVPAPTRVFIVRNTGISAVDRQGNEIWSRTGSVTARVADDASALYLFMGSDKSLTAIDANGATRWTISLEAASANLAVAPNNAIIVTSAGAVRSIDRTSGAVRWKTDLPGTFYTVAAVTSHVTLAATHFFLVLDASTGQLVGRSTTKFSGVQQPKCTAAGLQFVADLKMYRYPLC